MRLIIINSVLYCHNGGLMAYRAITL